MLKLMGKKIFTIFTLIFFCFSYTCVLTSLTTGWHIKLMIHIFRFIREDFLGTKLGARGQVEMYHVPLLLDVSVGWGWAGFHWTLFGIQLDF